MSGRRNHPAAPPPAAQLTALAGRLSAGDRQVCQLLGDHQVLTAGLLALLLGTPPRTLQQRLTTLTTLISLLIPLSIHRFSSSKSHPFPDPYTIFAIEQSRLQEQFLP